VVVVVFVSFSSGLFIVEDKGDKFINRNYRLLSLYILC